MGDVKLLDDLTSAFGVGVGATFDLWCMPTKPQPFTLEMFEQAMAEDKRRRDAGEYNRPQPVIVSPSAFIQFTGCCPNCERQLQEMAAADQQLARRQCACGVFLPVDWRVRLRTFSATLGAT